MNQLYYDIEYATALHEANMARLYHSTTTFMDGPDARNRHVARAAEVLYDDTEIQLQNSLDELIAAVAKHYDDPAMRPVSEANDRKAQELVGIVERFANHMNAHFERGTPFTAQSVFYAMTMTACATNHAVRQLQGESISRADDDVTARAYRDAMITTAEYPPNARAVIEGLRDEGGAQDDRMRRHLNLALEAVNDTDRIVAAHRKQQGKEHDGDGHEPGEQ